MTTDKQSIQVHPTTNGFPKYLGVLLMTLAILGGAMAHTNPTRQEYINYGADKLSEQVKKQVCRPSKIPDFLQGMADTLVDACHSTLNAQRENVKKVLDNSTTRQNYLLLSLYTTEIMGQKYQTIGAFGNFFTFNSEQVNHSK